MERSRNIRLLVVLGLVLLRSYSTSALLRNKAKITTITRQNNGDVFVAEDNECKSDTCIGLSSGTAATSGSDGSPHSSSKHNTKSCTCQCHSHLPAFREDLQICVDDIHECVLSPFVSGSTSQQIPFVFLPLKGQIIHPSKEISFAGIRRPVCGVSGAKFLTDGGWIDLRNPLDTDVPFRLFRDEGRTFLQWVGESELRNRMGGRLVLVHLMCREISHGDEPPKIFTPCVAFRVVGTPVKYLSNVSEVVFSTDTSSTSSSDSGLSVSEYVAIGVCSVLLGLIYVASVFLYLYIRRRKRETEREIKRHEKQALTAVEEGVVKNNPLLGLGGHFEAASYSDTCSSDTEAAPDIIQNHDDRKKNVQITSVLVHPPRKFSFGPPPPTMQPLTVHQESIECLPEENVSIVETLDCREDRPDQIKIMGSTRRKLYFNPAYFEPHLLQSPPPAAVEFLVKIREVIAIAKQKMAMKKFTPSLNGIPEEEPEVEDVRRGISLKRENSRRRTCSGCPGCEPQDFKALTGKLPEFPSLGACRSCTSGNVDSKQNSIRRWLEDVPVPVQQKRHECRVSATSTTCPKRLRSPARSLSPDHIAPIVRLPSRPASERARSPMSDALYEKASTSSRKSQSTVRTLDRKKPKAPPPPPPPKRRPTDNVYDVIREPLPPPDMIHEAMVVDGKTSSSPVEYDTDSLERSRNADYASQPSPSLSSALPLDEEMTMRNAVINTKTGNMTISTLNMAKILKPNEHEHDYELIVLKKRELLELPELLQNDRYSLVSEVYVNNGYNYGSAPSTPSESECSTLERKPKITYEPDKPGRLLIEVEDCPDNYIKAEDSDDFEPDTLDRKPKPKKEVPEADSLERPCQILLRTKGSFKKDEDGAVVENTFGSLREIFEAKLKRAPLKDHETLGWSQDEGKNLTLEERHCRRQRRAVPPDVIPPGSIETPLYERPKPPKRVPDKPPLPPKNDPVRGKKADFLSSFMHTEDMLFKNGVNDRVVLRATTVTTGDKFAKRRWPKTKLDDSGYLSTDSNDSHRKRPESETDESLGDGHSESGAESVETHSVFFGSFRKTSCSVDSGVGSVANILENGDSSDSETMSFSTVVPLTK